MDGFLCWTALLRAVILLLGTSFPGITTSSACVPAWEGVSLSVAAHPGGLVNFTTAGMTPRRETGLVGLPQLWFHSP